MSSQNPFSLFQEFNNLSSIEANINSNFTVLSSVLQEQLLEMKSVKDSLRKVERNYESLKRRRPEFIESPDDSRGGITRKTPSQKSITVFGSGVRDPQVLEYKQGIRRKPDHRVIEADTQTLQQQQSSSIGKNNDDDYIDLTLSKDYIRNSNNSGQMPETVLIGMRKGESVLEIQESSQGSGNARMSLRREKTLSLIPKQTSRKNLQLVSKQLESVQINTSSKDISAIEQKILEINERLGNLEVNESKSGKNNAKKLREVCSDLENHQNKLSKQSSIIKMYELEVSNLRGQLTEYKLKKESQLMKLSSNLHNTKGESNDTSFIIDKIIFLSKNVAQMLEKTKFNDCMEDLNQQLQQIKKNMKKFIQSEELDNAVQMLQRKFAKGVPHKYKNKDYSQIYTKPEKQNEVLKVDRDPEQTHSAPQTNYINHISESNTIEQVPLHQEGQENDEAYSEKDHELIDRVFAQEKRINQLSDDFADIAELLSQHRKITKRQIQEQSDKTIQNQAEISKMQFVIKSHQQFMKEMNKNYNQKLSENETQIIEIQDSINKMSNQIKFYQHTQRSETNASTSNQPQTQIGQQTRNIDLQNEVTALKKKVDKMSFKIQGAKEDVLGVRSDFAGDMDNVKALVERKADWDSLKQGLGFFQDKIKEMSIVLNSITLALNEDKQEGSVAAKKGWTCLCCDKEVKNLQGKLGDVKFTNIFPSRYESPRIGGYYKQNQTERQYKALYLGKQRRLIKSGNKETKDD